MIEDRPPPKVNIADSKERWGHCSSRPKALKREVDAQRSPSASAVVRSSSVRWSRAPSVKRCPRRRTISPAQVRMRTSFNSAHPVAPDKQSPSWQLQQPQRSVVAPIKKGAFAIPGKRTGTGTTLNSSTRGSVLTALDQTCLRQVRKCADRYEQAAQEPNHPTPANRAQKPKTTPSTANNSYIKFLRFSLDYAGSFLSRPRGVIRCLN